MDDIFRKCPQWDQEQGGDLYTLSLVTTLAVCLGGGFLVFLRENTLMRLVKYNLGRISLSVDRSETSDALIYVALLKHIFNLTL